MVAVAAVVVGIVAAVVVGIVAAVVVAIAAVLVGIVATVVVGIVAIVVVGIVATVHAITVVVTVTIAVIDIVVAGLVTAVVTTVIFVVLCTSFVAVAIVVTVVVVAAAVVAIVVVGLVQRRFLKGRYSNFGLTHVARTLFGSSLDRRFLGLGSCTGTRYWIGRGFGNVAFSLIFDLNCRLRVDRRMGYFVLNHSVHHICLRPLFFAIHCGNLLFGLCSSFRLTF